MNILPYRTYTFSSMLPVDEVRNRLYSITRQNASYTGDVLEHGFDIHRRISYRNSFLPMIKGKIAPSGKGTVIAVKMRMHVAVIAFAVIFTCIALAMFLSSVFRGWNLSDDFAPLVMIGAAVLMFTIPFAIEANIAKKDLARIFGCEPEKTNK